MANLSTNIDVIIPTGVILPFAGTTSYALPDGYAYCNGASLSTTAQPKLFATIGYTYGGSGGNFSLPNLNTASGPFIRGGTGPSGSSIIADSTKISSLTSSAGSAHQHVNTVGITNAGQSADHTHGNTGGESGNHSHTISGNGAHTTTAATRYYSSGPHLHTIQYRTFGGIAPAPGDGIAYNTGGSWSTAFMNGMDGEHVHLIDVTGTGTHLHANSDQTVGHTHAVSGGVSVGHTHANTVSITNVNESSHTHTIANAVAETAPVHMVMQYIIKL